LSDIFKKITSIEPVDEDALDALKITPSEVKPRRALLRPLPEDIPENDPVPEFITRGNDATTPLKEDLQATLEPITSDPVSTETQVSKVTETEPALVPSLAPPLAMTAEENLALSTGWMKWAGIAAVLIWLGASFAYVYGFFDLGHKWTDLTPIQIAGLLLAVLLPAILLGLLFYALRQLSKLSTQAHGLSRAAYTLTQPDDSVISKTAIMSKAIKVEIDSVDARIDQALARMNTLESVINRLSSINTAPCFGNNSRHI